MRGLNVDLRDIILDELPEQVDLHCDEVLQEEEEEEQQVHPRCRDLYQVAICCGLCNQPINFVCIAGIRTLRDLEQLLLGSLEFVCVGCVREHRLNHGG